MLGGYKSLKKIIFFITLSILIISCRNSEIVQKKDSFNYEIEEELRVWHIDEAILLIEKLEDSEKIKYLSIIEEKKEKLEKLYKVEGIVKEAFYTGDYSILDSYMDLGSVNSFKYKKLKEYGLSNIRVYLGNREFLDNNVDEIAVLNFFEESVYLELNLQYERNDWFIKSFDEKR